MNRRYPSKTVNQGEHAHRKCIEHRKTLPAMAYACRPKIKGGRSKTATLRISRKQCLATRVHRKLPLSSEWKGGRRSRIAGTRFPGAVRLNGACNKVAGGHAEAKAKMILPSLPSFHWNKVAETAVTQMRRESERKREHRARRGNAGLF